MVEKKTGLVKFAEFTEVALIISSVSWVLSLLYFLSDGINSSRDYILQDFAPILLAVTSFIFLFLYLTTKGLRFQNVLVLFRRPVVYVVLLSFFSSYLLNFYSYKLFETRFKLSQQALEDFARDPILDNDNSTVQWVGLFPLQEVDVAGTAVRMLVGECYMFDDCGFVYSPDGEPQRKYWGDSYRKIPFAKSWYYWQHRLVDL